MGHDLYLSPFCVVARSRHHSIGRVRGHNVTQNAVGDQSLFRILGASLFFWANVPCFGSPVISLSPMLGRVRLSVATLKLCSGIGRGRFPGSQSVNAVWLGPSGSPALRSCLMIQGAV